MFIGDSFSIIRTVVVGILSFILVVIVLRISGKRTLSKMNSFDFIVTVALGSVLASILTTRNLALFDGILAFSILVFMQFFTSWLSVRSDFISGLVKSQPTLLYYQGKFDRTAMKKERIPKSEILQAVRSGGKASLEEVTAVILETDGTFSILEATVSSSADVSAMQNVNKEK